MFCKDPWLGDALLKGEWRFNRRSASETSAGSGVGAMPYELLAGGGGIDAGSNGGYIDGDGMGC